jgi:hypothetical protein
LNGANELRPVRYGVGNCVIVARIMLCESARKISAGQVTAWADALGQWRRDSVWRSSAKAPVIAKPKGTQASLASHEMKRVGVRSRSRSWFSAIVGGATQ